VCEEAVGGRKRKEGEVKLVRVKIEGKGFL